MMSTYMKPVLRSQSHIRIVSSTSPQELLLGAKLLLSHLVPSNNPLCHLPLAAQTVQLSQFHSSHILYYAQNICIGCKSAMQGAYLSTQFRALILSSTRARQCHTYATGSIKSKNCHGTLAPDPRRLWDDLFPTQLQAPPPLPPNVSYLKESNRIYTTSSGIADMQLVSGT